jgi:hypothetical protein
MPSTARAAANVAAAPRARAPTARRISSSSGSGSGSSRFASGTSRVAGNAGHAGNRNASNRQVASPSLRVADREPIEDENGSHWPLQRAAPTPIGAPTAEQQQQTMQQQNRLGRKFSLHKSQDKSDRVRIMEQAWLGIYGTEERTPLGMEVDEGEEGEEGDEGDGTQPTAYGRDRKALGIHHAKALQNFLSYYLMTYGFPADFEPVTDRGIAAKLARKAGTPLTRLELDDYYFNGSSGGLDRGDIDYADGGSWPDEVPLSPALDDLRIIFVNTLQRLEAAQDAMGFPIDLLFSGREIDLDGEAEVPTDADRDVYTFFTTTDLSDRDLADLDRAGPPDDSERNEQKWRRDLFLRKLLLVQGPVADESSIVWLGSQINDLFLDKLPPELDLAQESIFDAEGQVDEGATLLEPDEAGRLVQQLVKTYVTDKYAERERINATARSSADRAQLYSAANVRNDDDAVLKLFIMRRHIFNKSDFPALIRSSQEIGRAMLALEDIDAARKVAIEKALPDINLRTGETSAATKAFGERGGDRGDVWVTIQRGNVLHWSPHGRMVYRYKGQTGKHAYFNVVTVYGATEFEVVDDPPGILAAKGLPRRSRNTGIDVLHPSKSDDVLASQNRDPLIMKDIDKTKPRSVGSGNQRVWSDPGWRPAKAPDASQMFYWLEIAQDVDAALAVLKAACFTIELDAENDSKNAYRVGDRSPGRSGLSVDFIATLVSAVDAKIRQLSIIQRYHMFKHSTARSGTNALDRGGAGNPFVFSSLNDDDYKPPKDKDEDALLHADDGSLVDKAELDRRLQAKSPPLKRSEMENIDRKWKHEHKWRVIAEATGVPFELWVGPGGWSNWRVHARNDRVYSHRRILPKDDPARRFVAKNQPVPGNPRVMETFDIGFDKHGKNELDTYLATTYDAIDSYEIKGANTNSLRRVLFKCFDDVETSSEMLRDPAHLDCRRERTPGDPGYRRAWRAADKGKKLQEQVEYTGQDTRGEAGQIETWMCDHEFIKGKSIPVFQEYGWPDDPSKTVSTEVYGDSDPPPGNIRDGVLQYIGDVERLVVLFMDGDANTSPMAHLFRTLETAGTNTFYKPPLSTQTGRPADPPDFRDPMFEPRRQEQPSCLLLKRRQAPPVGFELPGKPPQEVWLDWKNVNFEGSLAEQRDPTTNASILSRRAPSLPTTEVAWTKDRNDLMAWDGLSEEQRIERYQVLAEAYYSLEIEIYYTEQENDMVKKKQGVEQRPAAYLADDPGTPLKTAERVMDTNNKIAVGGGFDVRDTSLPTVNAQYQRVTFSGTLLLEEAKAAMQLCKLEKDALLIAIEHERHVRAYQSHFSPLEPQKYKGYWEPLEIIVKNGGYALLAQASLLAKLQADPTKGHNRRMVNERNGKETTWSYIDAEQPALAAAAELDIEEYKRRGAAFDDEIRLLVGREIMSKVNHTVKGEIAWLKSNREGRAHILFQAKMRDELKKISDIVSANMALEPPVPMTAQQMNKYRQAARIRDEIDWLCEANGRIKWAGVIELRLDASNELNVGLLSRVRNRALYPLGSQDFEENAGANLSPIARHEILLQFFRYDTFKAYAAPNSLFATTPSALGSRRRSDTSRHLKQQKMMQNAAGNRQFDAEMGVTKAERDIRARNKNKNNKRKTGGQSGESTALALVAAPSRGTPQQDEAAATAAVERIAILKASGERMYEPLLEEFKAMKIAMRRNGFDYDDATIFTPLINEHVNILAGQVSRLASGLDMRLTSVYGETQAMFRTARTVPGEQIKADKEMLPSLRAAAIIIWKFFHDDADCRRALTVEPTGQTLGLYKDAVFNEDELKPKSFVDPNQAAREEYRRRGVAFGTTLEEVNYKMNLRYLYKFHIDKYIKLSNVVNVLNRRLRVEYVTNDHPAFGSLPRDGPEVERELEKARDTMLEELEESGEYDADSLAALKDDLTLDQLPRIGIDIVEFAYNRLATRRQLVGDLWYDFVYMIQTGALDLLAVNAKVDAIRESMQYSFDDDEDASAFRLTDEIIGPAMIQMFEVVRDDLQAAQEQRDNNVEWVVLASTKIERFVTWMCETRRRFSDSLMAEISPYSTNLLNSKPALFETWNVNRRVLNDDAFDSMIVNDVGDLAKYVLGERDGDEFAETRPSVFDEELVRRIDGRVYGYDPDDPANAGRVADLVTLPELRKAANDFRAVYINMPIRGIDDDVYPFIRMHVQDAIANPATPPIARWREALTGNVTYEQWVLQQEEGSDESGTQRFLEQMYLGNAGDNVNVRLDTAERQEAFERMIVERVTNPTEEARLRAMLLEARSNTYRRVDLRPRQLAVSEAEDEEPVTMVRPALLAYLANELGRRDTSATVGDVSRYINSTDDTELGLSKFVRTMRRMLSLQGYVDMRYSFRQILSGMEAERDSNAEVAADLEQLLDADADPTTSELYLDTQASLSIHERTPPIGFLAADDVDEGLVTATAAFDDMLTELKSMWVRRMVLAANMQDDEGEEEEEEWVPVYQTFGDMSRAEDWARQALTRGDFANKSEAELDPAELEGEAVTFMKTPRLGAYGPLNATSFQTNEQVFASKSLGPKALFSGVGGADDPAADAEARGERGADTVLNWPSRMKAELGDDVTDEAKREWLARNGIIEPRIPSSSEIDPATGRPYANSVRWPRADDQNSMWPRNVNDDDRLANQLDPRTVPRGLGKYVEFVWMKLPEALRRLLRKETFEHKKLYARKDRSERRPFSVQWKVDIGLLEADYEEVEQSDVTGEWIGLDVGPYSDYLQVDRDGSVKRATEAIMYPGTMYYALPRELRVYFRETLDGNGYFVAKGGGPRGKGGGKGGGKQQLYTYTGASYLAQQDRLRQKWLVWEPPQGGVSGFWHQIDKYPDYTYSPSDGRVRLTTAGNQRRADLVQQRKTGATFDLQNRSAMNYRRSNASNSIQHFRTPGQKKGHWEMIPTAQGNLKNVENADGLYVPFMSDPVERTRDRYFDMARTFAGKRGNGTVAQMLDACAATIFNFQEFVKNLQSTLIQTEQGRQTLTTLRSEHRLVFGGQMVVGPYAPTSAYRFGPNDYKWTSANGMIWRIDAQEVLRHMIVFYSYCTSDAYADDSLQRTFLEYSAHYLRLTGRAEPLGLTTRTGGQAPLVDLLTRINGDLEETDDRFVEIDEDWLVEWMSDPTLGGADDHGDREGMLDSDLKQQRLDAPAFGPGGDDDDDDDDGSKPKQPKPKSLPMLTYVPRYDEMPQNVRDGVLAWFSSSNISARELNVAVTKIVARYIVLEEDEGGGLTIDSDRLPNVCLWHLKWYFDQPNRRRALKKRQKPPPPAAPAPGQPGPSGGGDVENFEFADEDFMYDDGGGVDDEDFAFDEDEDELNEGDQSGLADRRVQQRRRGPDDGYGPGADEDEDEDDAGRYQAGNPLDLDRDQRYYKRNPGLDPYAIAPRLIMPGMRLTDNDKTGVIDDKNEEFRAEVERRVDAAVARMRAQGQMAGMPTPGFVRDRLRLEEANKLEDEYIRGGRDWRSES